MQLTKTDFLEFLACDKALWLAKCDPTKIDWPTPTEFDRLLLADGYAVEDEVKRFVRARNDVPTYDFQRDFVSPDGLYARADLVIDHGDDGLELWEIKSSTRVKSSTSDHVLDAAFQTLVAERTGARVKQIGVIHVNGEYVRGETLKPEDFLVFADVTEEVRSRMPEVAAEADRALEMLEQTNIERAGCNCLLKSKSNHCAAFGYFNPVVPEPSIYDLPRLSQKKRDAFIADSRFALCDIDPSELTRLQAPVVKAAQENAPVINLDAIRAFLDGLTYPLYFYDYETFGSAVPIASGLRPHEQIPVQVSLHTLSADGELTHAECLTETPGQHDLLTAFLTSEIGPEGDLVSWNAPFEKAANTRLARLQPEAADWLAAISARTVDLMDVFKTDYVDIRFGGSTSIKKVLPVLVPDLRYDQDSVHDGAGAIEAWKRLIESETETEKAALRAALLAYCKLDTLAMVEIFRKLQWVIQASAS